MRIEEESPNLLLVL